MNNECDIIKDLLPLYAENLTSEASVSFVQNHIAHCECCREALSRFEGTMQIAPDTNVNALKKMKLRLCKRVVLPVITTILLFLSLLTGIVISATVPVWATAEEAIIFVEQEDSGRIRVKLSDSVCSINYMEGGRFSCKSVRFDWLLKFYREKIFNTQDHDLYFDLDADDSLWYAGQYVDEADTLLWGKNEISTDGVYYEEIDQSLKHTTIISLCLGSLVLICGAIFRKKKLHTPLMILSALLLTYGISGIFVTGGHFGEVWIPILRFNNVVKQYFAVAIMTFVSFITVISCGLLVKIYRDQ